jgi:hypothetical protein
MTQPRVFISFDFDNDSDSKMYFAGQAKNERVPFSFEDWSCKESLPQAEWERRIKDKINNCNVLLVLVSKNTTNAVGVRKEISMAVEQDVPVVGVYIKNADTNTHLPNGLSASYVRQWHWDSIKNLLDAAMARGKNRK